MVPLRLPSSSSARILALLLCVNGSAVAVASCSGDSGSQTPSGGFTTGSGSSVGGQGGAGPAGGQGGAAGQGGVGAQGGAGEGGANGTGGAGEGGANGTGGTGGANGTGGSGESSSSASSSSASSSSASSSSASSSSSGGGGEVVDGGLPDALPDFTDAELEPVTTIDGIPNPLPGVYVDLGPAPAQGNFRSLIAFNMRDKPLLEETVGHMYDPTHPNFRKYMTPEQWMDLHGPSEVDVQLVRLWLESQGFTVQFTATNRLLLEFTGTVQQFNDVFHTTLHIFERENPQIGNPPIDVFGTLEPIELPLWVAGKIRGIISADLAAETGQLPAEGGGVVVQAPAATTNQMTPAKIAKAYKLDSLYAQGFRGKGVKLGVTVGATFKFKDLQSFWQSFGIVRADPVIVQTMEPFVTRYIETTLDVEWAGAMAPESDLIVYSGPDARNTSMIYTFNEAIARNEVDVITDSFAHREDSEPALVRLQYSDSALEAAALGITVLAATGDSGGADTPSVSPWVTGVGGTRLQLTSAGAISSEIAWSKSGCGTSLTLLQPDWQAGIVPNANGKRATADVAMNADPASPYFVYYLAQWKLYGGTSFSSPAFAGLIATVDSYRKANNLPRLGFLNSLLYKDSNIQKTFRDVTSGGPVGKQATVGWDYPSGWGAPSAIGLATTLP